MQTNTKIQLASIILVVVMALAYMANQQNLRLSYSNKSRSIASIETSNYDPDFSGEALLAKEVAKTSPQRSLASVGQPANDLETLRFGALEGKYAFKMKGSFIQEISYINSASQPTIINDRANFLSRFGSQFGFATKPKRLSSVLIGDKLVETYKVKLNGSDSEKLVQFTLGESNALLGLKLTDAPSLRIF